MKDEVKPWRADSQRSTLNVKKALNNFKSVTPVKTGVQENQHLPGFRPGIRTFRGMPFLRDDVFQRFLKH